jgi:hypothetical protein
VNAESLLSVIGEIDERYIAEAASRKSGKTLMIKNVKKPSEIWRKAAQIAACAVVLITAVLLIQNRVELINAPEDSGMPISIITEAIPAVTSVTAISETPAVTTNSTETATVQNDDIININVLDYAPWMSSPFGPRDDELVPMTFEEIELYFGTAIAPGYLPPDLVFEDVYAKQNPGGKRGVYKDADGEIIYDKYSLTYLTAANIAYYEENGRFETLTPKGVYISTGKISGIGTGIRWNDEGVLPSQIGGYDVMLASYEIDVMHFVAVFDKDDVHFAIETVDIPESEFLKIVRSYLYEIN